MMPTSDTYVETITFRIGISFGRPCITQPSMVLRAGWRGIPQKVDLRGEILHKWITTRACVSGSCRVSWSPHPGSWQIYRAGDQPASHQGASRSLPLAGGTMLARGSNLVVVHVSVGAHRLQFGRAARRRKARAEAPSCAAAPRSGCPRSKRRLPKEGPALRSRRAPSTRPRRARVAGPSRSGRSGWSSVP